jgi:DNA-binding transcriptional regulator PaaX
MLIKIGSLEKRVLILLFGWMAIGLACSPGRQWKILQAIGDEWEKTSKQSFERSLRSLARKKLLMERKNKDGSVTFVLTKKGQKSAELCDLYGGSLKFKKPGKWDKRWRVVMFDIPEKNRIFRGILREHLQEIGFVTLQQSVFVYPYPCENQLIKLAELYSASAYVRILTVSFIDNESKLREKFKI